MKRYRARLVLSGDAVLEDAVLSVEAGVVRAVGDGPHDVDLGNVALVPGQVNAHSHAFQRALRGRTEYRPADRPDDDFWSWRARMYEVANALDPDGVEAVSALAFLEMAKAGITTVGEFHYLHHQPGGTPYADPGELAHRVIRAARRVGLRVVLLRVAYERAGHGRPAEPHQRRFVDRDPGAVVEQVQRLARSHDADPLVGVGLAPHSVRAVSREWLEAFGSFTGPLHVHACEQRAELEQCRAEHGVEPVALLADCGVLRAGTTLVHATHLEDGALDRLAASGAGVCACPTTERNLGDGFLPARALLAAGIPISLGSDSHATIDPFEELRLVEYHERLRAERRNVLASHAEPVDGRLETARALLPLGTTSGARALGLPGGGLRPGEPADFTTLALDDPSLLGATRRTLPTDLVFSTATRAVRDVFVAGEQIVFAGQHPAEAEIAAGFLGALPWP